MLKLSWFVDEHLNHIGRADGVEITLVPRPHYCDRGRFLAYIEGDWSTPQGKLLNLNLDHSDGFPRYYFDVERAYAELEAFVNARKELLPESDSNRRAVS